ncbi:zona pellucida sperm-binding protein 3-like [Spea bombifrons]|uniref:zona pellucida sperm-binding protein 3-like n=1 Tax=Spea bombifrons TaxID=233779 RepID=UPI00234A2137|nr:zona pellucida sperm-binding protein 3-like [Spea bombifrons]
MGQWVRLSCLVLVALLSGLVFAVSSQQVLARNRRRWDHWRSGSQPWSGWGSGRQYGGVVGQPRQLQASGEHPISVRCMEDRMEVSVNRDLYRNGRLVKASDLSLGPRLCKPNSESTGTTVIFQYGLQECGNTLQMTPEFLVYSTNLTYSPTPSLNSPIIRTNSAVVPIQCYYPRHGNVSSNAIKPTWMPFSSTISAEERLSFSLRLMNEGWTAPRTSTVFKLGEVFHIEASVAVGNHVPMKIFVDSCVATLSPDGSSGPRYDIIEFYGCLLDGREEDSSSAFRSPRPRPDTLQFMVDAFRFTGTDASVIYITCNLRAAAENQAPDQQNKACSYSKATNSWSELEGSSDICRCCVTGNCARTVLPGSQFSRYGRQWKREAVHIGALSEQEHELATLGPLLVIGADRTQALALTQEAVQVEFWVLVAVGSLSLTSLMIVVGKFIIAKRLSVKPEPE